jgi:hypothetical protein
MQPRDYVLTGAALVLLAGLGLVLLSDSSAAGVLPAPAGVEAPQTPEPHGDEPDAAPQAVAGGPVATSEVAVADPVFRPSSHVDTTGWTKGIIRGDIPLTASIVKDIRTIGVHVDELKNVREGGARPFRLVVPVELGKGTPTFEVRDVPFSDYGYVVRVHSPGLNGGQATVAINVQNPIADGLKLAITPGSPFTLLLRDQDRRPVAMTEIRMLPVGEPLGRPRYDAKTDNYGSAVFENVLAGDYQAHIGPLGQELIAPSIVTVQPGTWLQRGSVVQPQGQTIVVPLGVAVLATVVQRGGYPLPGARVRLRTTDRPRIVEYELESDVRGQAHFQSVLPGMWEIEVVKPDFERRSVQLTIQEGVTPPEQKFELIRLR